MLRGFTIFILHLWATVTWAVGDSLSQHLPGDVQDEMDTLAHGLHDKLLDRILTVPLSNATLDETTQGKPSLSASGSALPLRDISAYAQVTRVQGATFRSAGPAIAQDPTRRAAQTPSLRISRGPTPRVQGPTRRSAQTPSFRRNPTPALGQLQRGAPGPTFRGPSLSSPSQRRGRGGFLRAGVDIETLPSTDEADQLLRRFERGFGISSGGRTEDWQPALRESCRSLAAQATRITIGICATSAALGISNLKGWVADLGLPKGRLFGLDVDGVLVPPPHGAVYIKYNSDTGDAKISSYPGAFRGVVFTPTLTDGKFRQFGHLPLSLLQDEGMRRRAKAAPPRVELPKLLDHA